MTWHRAFMMIPINSTPLQSTIQSAQVIFNGEIRPPSWDSRIGHVALGKWVVKMYLLPRWAPSLFCGHLMGLAPIVHTLH